MLFCLSLLDLHWPHFSDMCILFGYIDNEANSGSYKVIIASNRDEDFERPAAITDRWATNPSCIGGAVNRMLKLNKMQLPFVI